MKIDTKKVTAPPAVIALIDTAAGSPPREVFELLALADRFVALKQLEDARLKAEIYRLQRRVTNDLSDFVLLEDHARLKNRDTANRIATDFTDLIARVQELMSPPDAQVAESVVTDRMAPSTNTTMSTTR